MLTILRNRFGRLRGDEQGSSIVLAGLAMIGLLAMTGLVVDGGTLFAERARLQKAADAAVLSGAQELTRDEASVRAVAETVLADHGIAADEASIAVDMGRKAALDLHADVPLAFSGLFGADTGAIDVHAAAEIDPMTAAAGAAPLGIADSVALVYGETYTLKVDQTESSNGFFGVLALGGPGAATYEDNLANGYGSELRVGDILDTQTGNIAGKTRDGVQDRLNRSPYPEGETWHRDDPRILLIPVYHPYQYGGGQMTEVQITGFAYFYLSEPMNWQDKTIKGQFIHRAGTGTSDPGQTSYGAFGIRLTE